MVSDPLAQGELARWKGEEGTFRWSRCTELPGPAHCIAIWGPSSQRDPVRGWDRCGGGGGGA